MKVSTAKSAHKSSRQLRHVTIRPADNGGFTVEKRFHPTPGPKNMPYDFDGDEETTVHESPESLHSQMAEMFPVKKK